MCFLFLVSDLNILRRETLLRRYDFGKSSKTCSSQCFSCSKKTPTKQKIPQKTLGRELTGITIWVGLLLVLYAWLLVSWQKSMVPFSHRKEKEMGVKFFLMDSFNMDLVLYLCVSIVSPKNKICYSISKIRIYACIHNWFIYGTFLSLN